jgi:hypothetical protein
MCYTHTHTLTHTHYIIHTLRHAQRETGARFYPKALYSMLHYLIHTCRYAGVYVS